MRFGVLDFRRKTGMVIGNRSYQYREENDKKFLFNRVGSNFSRTMCSTDVQEICISDCLVNVLGITSIVGRLQNVIEYCMKVQKRVRWQRIE